jgi:xanthine dehydrogenase YagR molybdenum-binding subunit
MNDSPFGHDLPRVEGFAKVTGMAHFASDFNEPEQAHAVIVTSTIALGRVASIDTTGVSLTGVLAIISHRNAISLPYNEQRAFVDPAIGERLHVFQDDKIHFLGQPVAVVVAETLEQAEHAAAAVGVEYEADTPLVRLDAPDAEQILPEATLRPGSRVLANYARGDADAALLHASMHFESEYRMERENHNPMEPHSTLASWCGDQLTLWSKSQFPTNEVAQIAANFGIPAEGIKVICPYIGGAFGTTLRTWPHVTIAALAARQVRRPVKLTLTRRQMFYITGYRPRTIQRLSLGGDQSGRLSAIVHDGVGETSRYEQFVEALTMVSTYLYSCTNVRTRYRLIPLDVSTPNHMRAPGESSGIFALESAMDEFAAKLQVDPVQLRIRNEPTLDETGGRPFSSRSLIKCIEVAADRFCWSRRNPHPRSMRDGRWLIGLGMACATYPTLQGAAGARVRLMPNETAEIEVATTDMGPGTYTSLTQIAADVLGLPMARVCVRIGCSTFPSTPAHGGSMTMTSVGSAVHAACLAARKQALVQAGDQVVQVEISCSPSEERNRYSTHSFGAVFVEVAVDRDLGVIHLRKAVGAYAAGRIINPRLAHSQCIGGMVGGIGMALMERTIIDSRSGRPVNASLTDYLVPVNADVGCVLEALLVEEEDHHVNSIGVKGLGELALIGIAPAIANAVYHATGRRIRELPIRIESLIND